MGCKEAEKTDYIRSFRHLGDLERGILDQINLKPTKFTTKLECNPPIKWL